MIDNKGFTPGFHVRISGDLREPDPACCDAGFAMVSYFGDTPLEVKRGTFAKSGLKTRIMTSPILGAVGIKTRREGIATNGYHDVFIFLFTRRN
jgi:hypothetical protein